MSLIARIHGSRDKEATIGVALIPTIKPINSVSEVLLLSL